MDLRKKVQPGGLLLLGGGLGEEGLTARVAFQAALPKPDERLYAQDFYPPWEGTP